MLTPGPSCVDPRVYRALAAPLVGHVDPWFTDFMGGLQELLRRVFQTANHMTFPISASGTGGIETAVVNVLEPGDEGIVCVNGVFSERMAVIAGTHTRHGPPRFRRRWDSRLIRRMSVARGEAGKIKFYWA